MVGADRDTVNDK